MDEDFDLRDVNDDLDARLAATRSHEQEFVGLSEPGAKALAVRLSLQLRVIRHDGAALTLDLRPNRMTVDLRTGTVTSAKAG